VAVSFKIVTLGCKVNQYESAYLASELVRSGWMHAGPGRPADVVVVNTCIVTATAQRQSRQAVRKAIRENPGALVAATGCYAQVFGEELSGIPGLHLVVDNREKVRLPELLRDNGKGQGSVRVLGRPFGDRVPFQHMPLESFPDRSRAFLKIQDGCDAYCSYCIVPYARGPCRSLAPGRVLEGLETLSRRGYREVVLTGIHLGRYGADLGEGVDLVGLLGLILRENLPLRIRLSSLEPGEIRRPLIEMAASEERLCAHFHIPLQSGDDGVLRRMNRRYGRADFARVVRAIRDEIPQAGIGVDVMAGFPGEDEKAHGNTKALLRDLPVSYLHVFPYSPRKGTPASRFREQVEPSRIKERAAALRNLGNRKKRAFQEACLDRVFEILVERGGAEEGGLCEGTSENYLTVRFPLAGARIGDLVPVRTELSVRGALVGSPTGGCTAVGGRAEGI